MDLIKLICKVALSSVLLLVYRAFIFCSRVFGFKVVQASRRTPSKHRKTMQTLVALAALVLSTQALADQYRPAVQSIWTMSETHLVLHEHDTARQHAELRIIERETGKEAYRGESSTFTLLVPVEEESELPF